MAAGNKGKRQRRLCKHEHVVHWWRKRNRGGRKARGKGAIRACHHAKCEASVPHRCSGGSIGRAAAVWRPRSRAAAVVCAAAARLGA